MGRIERSSRCVDVGTGQFAFFDAAADGESVGGIGAEIDDGGESAAEEHVGKLRVKRGGGFPVGHRPLGLGEMDVGIPEAGGYDAMIAGNDGGVGGNDDLVPYRRDEAVADKNGAVFDGGIVGET